MSGRAARRPARVLMTADAVGGVWDYALELARGLARHGVATTLAVMGDAPDASRRAAAGRVPGLVLEHGAFRLEWMADPEEDLRRAADWLLDLERRVRPDVVHVNGYAQAALPFRAPVLCVAHSCVLSWWRAVHGHDAPAREWAAYAARVAEGLRMADLVVAPTAAMLGVLGDLYGPPPRRRVIHNGRDPALYRPRPKGAYVLSAGRVWDAAKNIAALDAVAPRLPWPVLVAGDIRGPDGVPRPPRHLRHLGRLPSAALAGRLGRAAVFALPARYEPFGLAALEAALSGCALVLGDVPTLRELWDGAALFVAPDDRHGLATALEALAADPGRTRALGALARRRAHAYTANRMTLCYLDAYGDLLGGFGRDGAGLECESRFKVKRLEQDSRFWPDRPKAILL
ncbi:glycosyltransferase family 4 protein [Azospirillum sp. A39]|uniref:glycosyltransferase family 4 protein n=1 Tax=Azospirillum sp. A39 TaxID=3462279 RepID=UPI0040460CC8